MTWPSLDGAMPTIDLAHVADRAMSSASATAMWGGVGIVGLGFLVRVLGEFVRSSAEEGYTPRYLRQTVILVGFVALMAGYKPMVMGTVRVVSRMGSEMGSMASLEETFSTRMARFGQYIQTLDKTSSFRAQFTVDGILARVFQLATMFVYIGVQCVMFIIKAIQLFALAAIITYGPILIGIATLGGIFASLGIAWFWSLVEVSAWSFTVDILLHVFAGFGSTIPETFSYVQEIILAVTLMALLVATIPLTGSLVRGQGASALAYSASYLAGKAVSAGAMGVGAAGVVGTALSHPAGNAAKRAGPAVAAASRGIASMLRRASTPGPAASSAGDGWGSSGRQTEPPWMGEKVHGRQERKAPSPASPRRGSRGPG